MLRLFLALFFLLPMAPAFAQDISGKARVVDGDTIYVGSTKIRLHGIDAPEAKQYCTHKGKKWNCGQEATFALAYMVSPHWLECKERDRDRYGRIVAVCFTGPYDVGAKMVRQGWALAYRRYSMDYVDEEIAAKRAKVGMWKGEFVKPWKWRQK